MKKNEIITIKTINSPIEKSSYEIIKASRAEIQLSMKHACEEAEIIKERNRTLIHYQHKFIVTKPK